MQRATERMTDTFTDSRTVEQIIDREHNYTDAETDIKTATFIDSQRDG